MMLGMSMVYRNNDTKLTQQVHRAGFKRPLTVVLFCPSSCPQHPLDQPEYEDAVDTSPSAGIKNGL